MVSNDITFDGSVDPRDIVELAQRVMADPGHNTTDLVFLYQSALLAAAVIGGEPSPELRDALQTIVDSILERAEAGDEHAQLAAEAYALLSDPDAAPASIRIAETALHLLLALPFVKNALLDGDDHETVAELLDGIDDMILGQDSDMEDLTDEEMDQFLATLGEDLDSESGQR